MAIFGFKKRKDEKLEQSATEAKSLSGKALKSSKQSKIVKSTKGLETIARSGSKEIITKRATTPVMHSGAESSVASVIIRPRVTEKSGVLSQNGVYTFEVTKNANKNLIAKAITALYKVRPIKIAVINTPIKNVFVKGRRGQVAGMRKAIVTVKKGEKIDFI
jgi:large subunit ribosomal protein L23